MKNVLILVLLLTAGLAHAQTPVWVNYYIEPAKQAGSYKIKPTMTIIDSVEIWTNKMFAKPADIPVPAFGALVEVISNKTTTDFGNGWVLANGRAITTLTVTQRAVATNIGYVNNIPNLLAVGLGDRRPFIYLGP